MWNTKDDLELFLESYMDGPKPMTEDEVHNIVYGIACMHDLKSDRAFRTFEKLLKEIHDAKAEDTMSKVNEALEQAARVVETHGLDPVSILPTESFRDGIARQIRKLKIEGEDS
jgi:predicted DNA-binding transcriptional regulator YafY